MPGLPPLPTACVLLIAWPFQHPRFLIAGGLIVAAVALGLVIAGRV